MVMTLLQLAWRLPAMVSLQGEFYGEQEIVQACASPLALSMSMLSITSSKHSIDAVAHELLLLISTHGLFFPLADT